VDFLTDFLAVMTCPFYDISISTIAYEYRVAPRIFIDKSLIVKKHRRHHLSSSGLRILVNRQPTMIEED